MINPQELKNTGFSKSFKGYTCAEVDRYVDYVVEQYTELYRANTELEKKLKIVSSKLEEAKNEQDSVSASIVNAQKMADEIIKDANEKENAINSAIKASFDEIVSKYREVISTQQKKLYEAQKNAVDFKNGILDGYKEQVKMLCELIPVDSLDDTEQKSVEEVVESAISSAGAKLGIADKETDIEEPVENADRDSSVSGN